MVFGAAGVISSSSIPSFSACPCYTCIGHLVCCILRRKGGKEGGKRKGGGGREKGKGREWKRKTNSQCLGLMSREGRSTILPNYSHAFPPVVLPIVVRGDFHSWDMLFFSLELVVSGMLKPLTWSGGS